MSNMQYKNKEWLYNEYINKNKKMRDIAIECNVSYTIINYWITKFRIPKKTRDSYQYNKEKYSNKEWLYNEYITKKKSSLQIAKENKISKSTVLYWLKKNNIDIRSTSEALKNNNNADNHKVSTKSREIISINTRKALSNPEIRKKMSGENSYMWKGKKTKYIGKHKWVNEHKIKEGTCLICNEYKKTEFANKDHQYSRKLDDYIELCRTCHRLYDRLING